MAHPEQVYEALLVEFASGGCDMPTYHQLKTEFPVLGILCRNPRLLSIAMPQLGGFMQQNRQSSTQTDKEIVNTTITGFLESNAMDRLSKDRKASSLVGAQALAVHLFQTPVDLAGRSRAQREELALSLDYGIRFRPFYNSILYHLVARYGLLEPNDFPEPPGRF